MGLGDERALSDIRIWRGEAAVGVGFVVGDRHLMTCAHVVSQALGLNDGGAGPLAPSGEILIDFLAVPDGPERVKVRAKVHIWRPWQGASPHDIAVLELVEGQVPPLARPVKACADLRFDDRFRSFGVGANLSEGRIIQGHYAGQTGDDRLQIDPDKDFQAVAGGCSGGAMWNVSRGGIIGMVADAQGLTARVISVEHLCKVYPIATVGPSDTQSALVADRKSISSVIWDRLQHFDREPQSGVFELALDGLWEQRRSAVVCIIAGRPDDMPELLQHRFVDKRLASVLESLEIAGRKVTPQKISWPNRPKINPDAELRLLQAQLKAQVPGAKGLAPADILAAYNTGIRPLALFCPIDERVFDETHELLLMRWLDFLAEMEPLRMPLAVFLRFQLGEAAEQVSHLASLYQARLREDATPGAWGLPELDDFCVNDLADWLVETATEIDLSHDVHSQVETSLLQLIGTRRVRLRALTDWAKSLPF